MKRFSEQFYTKAQTVKMTAAEKRALRERVVSYMEYHPIASTSVPTPYRDDLLTPALFNKKTWRTLQFAIPAMFLMVIGVSSMAEKAVPGDTLYAVKQVNEDLRSTMVRGSYEKVVWETELLNRRIAEARVLASEGRLTEEAEIKVAKAVKEHTENARKEIETLKEVDEDEATLAAIEFTTALSVQTTALQNESAKSGDVTNTDLLTEVVQVAAEAVGQVTEDNNLPAYDKLMAKVESETTRARELLLSITNTATPEERSDVERRLSDIDFKITTAEGEVGVDEIKSREGLVAVLEQTHKLIVFMTNIDVRASMTVEEVVPVTLTESERIDNAKGDMAKASELIVLIETTLAATGTTPYEVAVVDKTTEALGLSKLAITTASEALALSPVDLVLAEGASLEAYNLVRDAAKMLGLLPAEISGEVPEEVIPAEGDITEESIEVTTEEEEATEATTTPTTEVSTDTETTEQN